MTEMLLKVVQTYIAMVIIQSGSNVPITCIRLLPHLIMCNMVGSY
jgi:hypothetical protein